eukprot:3096291-Rhodomonas_salina.1
MKGPRGSASGSAPSPRAPHPPLPDGELYKDAKGNPLDCNLCNKVGIGLPQSNHIAALCPDLCDNIAKLSLPGGTLQHTSNGNHPSKVYVPPAGTGVASVAFESTPAENGALMAQT